MSAAEFNDVFAFFVNGVNCALTPGTSDPIAVNTVNPGSNSLFYVPNGDVRHRDLRHPVRRLHRGPHLSRRGQSRRPEHVAAGHCRCQRRHPRLRRVPPGERRLVEPDRAVAADHAEPAARHPAGAATAAALSATQSIVPGGTSISLKVTGGDVPDTALAVALNVTAVDGVSPGFLTIFPDGATQPGTSSVNFPAQAASPNSVVAKIGAGGRIRIFANVSVDVVVDVFGWFGPGGSARLFTVVPDRVLDTRIGGTPVGRGQTIDVQITGTPRVPVGASAAVLNVTATEAVGPGFLTVYPSDRTQPLVSSVNYVAGVPRPNSVIAPIGADGKIKIFASEQTHVIVDVMGWLGNAGQSEYVDVPSTRLLDTRLPADTGPKLAAGGTIHLQVVGAVVPPNARSVVLNVTVTAPDESGFLTVYPGGAPRPFTSNLNYLTGQTIPNAVIVGLGPTGTIDIFSLRSTHVVVDVVGYFA